MRLVIRQLVVNDEWHYLAIAHAWVSYKMNIVITALRFLEIPRRKRLEVETPTTTQLHSARPY